MKCRLMGLGVLIALMTVPALADRPLTEDSLDGTYSTSGIWVRIGEDSSPVYCSGYGTITFHGDGNGQMENTQLCGDPSFTETGDDSADITYYVAADGRTFYITTLPTQDTTEVTTRCELLQRGAIILCDGTERGGDLYALHFVAVKR